MKAITSASTDSVIETEVGMLLNHVSPTKESDVRRRSLISHIQSLFDEYCTDFKLAMGGSFPLQVYLPESDMDVTVLTPDSENIDELNTVMQIFACLCQAIKSNEKQNSLPFAVDDAEFKIQSIEFINARIRVVTCVINRMSVDITANQRNSLATATFLEEANRIIGHNGLFKQGIILVKCWCLQESAKYNNLKVSISGSKDGMFSSYALSILVLYLFNIVPTQLTTPLQILRAFLETFSSFQFDKYVLTLDGPIPIQNGGSSIVPPQCEERRIENRFRVVAERVHASLHAKTKGKEKNTYMADFGTFRLRTCNIVDPVDPVNNLGVSVTWKNFWCFKSTLTTGLQHLNDSLMYMESSLVKMSPAPSSSPVMPDVNMTTPPMVTNSNNSINPTTVIACSSPPPPPSTQRKPLINMGSLSGAVNGIAPGLNFPSSTSNPTGNIPMSLSNSPTPAHSLGPPEHMSDLDIHALPLSPPSSCNTAPNALSPPPPLNNIHNNNPPAMLIAPSMSTSPAITGIAAGGIPRGSSNGNHASAPSPVSVPVLPTNTVALAKEFRFLKRFFPNCVANYQLEKVYGSMNYLGQSDTTASNTNITNNSGGGSCIGNSTYLSKLSRSTSPFRDYSPVMPSHRGDRSHSISCSSQQQQSQLQSQLQLQTLTQGRGMQPSRTTSDNASNGCSTNSDGSGKQPVSFLGGTTVPKRMRSQSYTSSEGRERRKQETYGGVIEALEGDLTAMWEALNYTCEKKNSPDNKKNEKKLSLLSRTQSNSQEHTQASSTDYSRATLRTRAEMIGNSSNCHSVETDSSDALTSVDDSSHTFSPEHKQTNREREVLTPFSSLDSSQVDVDRHRQVQLQTGASVACGERGEGEQRVRLLSPRATASICTEVVSHHPSNAVTHPAMPPLIKKMPPLSVAKQKNNLFTLLESPINRKIASENNIQAMTSRPNSLSESNFNNSNNVNSSNNSSKSKRKKGKSKDIVDSTDTKSKIKSKQSTQNMDPSAATSITSESENNESNVDDIRIHQENINNNINNETRFWENLSLTQYIMAVGGVIAIGLCILYFSGWFSPTHEPYVEMRSAYMRAHHNHAYQGSNSGGSSSGSRSSNSGRGSTNPGKEVIGSGFGKKVHSSAAISNPLEEVLELELDEGGGGSTGGSRGNGIGGDIDDDEEKNMSALYDTSINFDANESSFKDRGDVGGVVPPSHSSLLEDADDLVNIAELWLVKGQNVTLGLSQKAQEAYNRYMSGIKTRLLAAPGDDLISLASTTTKQEGMWFKDSTPLMHSNSSMYLKVTNMNVNTSGIYTFAIVKQKIRKGFSARPSSKVMRTIDANGRLSSSAPPSSATAVASVNGDVSIIDAKVDPASFEVIRVLARTVLRLGALPSCKTKPFLLVLTTGSQLYLHIDEEGSPTPSIQWYKNGVALKKERKNELIVNNVGKHHEGTYTCALVNMAGRFMWLEATVLINDE